MNLDAWAAVPVPAIAFDRMYQVAWTNPAGEALLGAELVGRHLAGLLPADSQAAVDAAMARVALGGGVAVPVRLKGASSLILTPIAGGRTLGWFVDAPTPAARPKPDRVAPATERAIAERLSAIVSNLRTPTAQVLQTLDHLADPAYDAADRAVVLADARRAARRLQDVLDQYGRLDGVAPGAVGHVSGARVLVIDDDKDVRTGIARRLRRKHEVHEAGSGHEAIRLLEIDGDWSLILCDLRMPDGNGGDVIRWLDQHRPEILDRFVLLTADATVGREVLSTSRGEVMALTKPILPDQVDGLIESVRAVRPA